MTINQADFLQKALLDNGHEIRLNTQTRLLDYLALLEKWNNAFNLTSISPQDQIMLHILDSLTISPYLHGTKLIDVGTGAGLPGIPLALTDPEKFFVLLDSRGKKTRFLTHVVHELQIPNVEIVHQRSELYYREEEEKFDTILSRAFGSLRVMLEATEHLIAEQGQFLAMKGNYPEKELRDIPDRFKVIAVHPLTIKGLNAKRHLVCMEKKP